MAPNILTGILRDSLGFKGMIVTDALNMAGVADAYGAEAGVRAFLAGADLLLQPADPRAAIDAMAARGGPRRDHAPSGSTARSGGCSRPSARWGCSPGAPWRSTASRPSWAAPRSRPTPPRSRPRSIVMVKDSAGVIHGLGARAARRSRS